MAKSITITIPGQAPSKGNFRMYSKNWRAKWKRIKDFEEAVGKEALAKGASSLRKRYKKCKVHTVCYNQKADGGNINKAVLDGLQGVCYDNDKDVAESSEPRRVKGARARVAITITFS